MRILLSLLLVGASWTLAAQAELAILKGGDVLKITDYEVEDQQIRLQLKNGGLLRLPILRVERIVEDEIVVEPEPLPEPAPVFSLRYEDGHATPPTPYGDLIHAKAQRYGVNPDLISAMVRWESKFDAGAVSPKGARGLLQLMPATAERFGVTHEELNDPERNLEAGSRYLAFLIDHFEEDLPRVLAAYNAGEGTVERYDGVPPYRETRNYVRRIYGELGLDATTAAQ